MCLYVVAVAAVYAKLSKLLTLFSSSFPFLFSLSSRNPVRMGETSYSTHKYILYTRAHIILPSPREKKLSLLEVTELNETNISCTEWSIPSCFVSLSVCLSFLLLLLSSARSSAAFAAAATVVALR